jgi:hypothetical protein
MNKINKKQFHHNENRSIQTFLLSELSFNLKNKKI